MTFIRGVSFGVKNLETWRHALLCARPMKAYPMSATFTCAMSLDPLVVFVFLTDWKGAGARRAGPEPARVDCYGVVLGFCLAAGFAAPAPPAGRFLSKWRTYLASARISFSLP